MFSIIGLFLFFFFFTILYALCRMSLILWFGEKFKGLYFLATEETDIEKKKKKDEDDSPKGKIPYPTQIFYIISMEACERFSYYGMNGKES